MADKGKIYLSQALADDLGVKEGQQIALDGYPELEVVIIYPFESITDEDLMELLKDSPPLA